jgi:ubiquinone/menaquinone biosynthesis C-methylase UbiE
VSNNHVDQIRDQFTRQAQAYADTAQAKDAAAHAKLAALVGLRASDRVLDVACGPGFLTRAFALRCAEAVGVDATDALLDIARRNALEHGVANVRFDSGDATELPYADGAFDVVICRAAFHHFPNPSRVLGEMRRVAKHGGKVMVADFVTSPNAQFARAHNAIERLCDPTHVRALPADQLRALFIDKELEIVEERPGRMHYGLTDWLAHGGPAPEAEQEIRRRFAQALGNDETGLDVRRDGDETYFTHQTLVLVGRR